MLQRNDGPAQIAAPARDLIKDARPKRSYSRFFVPNSAKIYPSILTEFLQNSHFSLIFIFKFLPSEAPKHKAKHRKWLACLAKQLRPRLGGLHRRLHERLQVKPSQTFVSGPASRVKPVLKPSAAYTGKVKS